MSSIHTSTAAETAITTSQASRGTAAMSPAATA
jgi:hypothetical protein